MTTPTRIDAILDYWLGHERGGHNFDAARIKFWFRADPDVDSYIRAHFEPDVLRAARGELEDWKQTPAGWLALIILLDQFPRNIYRGTPGAYTHDAQAHALSVEGIEREIDKKLSPIERVFFYLPLEHTEDPTTQMLSVCMFGELMDAIAPQQRAYYQTFYDYAVAHRDVIQRFGRFPDLNAILGRVSTPEEIEFLKQPGSVFL